MTRGRAALRLGLVLTLVAGVAGVALAATGRGGTPAPAALRVVPAGRNAAIERRALDHVAGQARAARATPPVPSRADLAALYARPRVLGLVELNADVAIAGVRDDVRAGGRPVAVYSVVTLEVRDGRYVPTRATTACDQHGSGLAFSVPVPGGGAALLAVGVTGDVTLPFPDGPRTGPAAFAAWFDAHGADEQPVATGLGGGTAACPRAG